LSKRGSLIGCTSVWVNKSKAPSHSLRLGKREAYLPQIHRSADNA